MTRAEKAQKMTVQDGGNRALQSRFFAKKEETEGVSAGKTRAGGTISCGFNRKSSLSALWDTDFMKWKKIVKTV